MRFWAAITTLLLLRLVSVEARENKLPADAAAALESGSQFVLYSLLPELVPGIGFDDDPFAPPEEKKKKEASQPVLETLHEYKILGHTRLVDAADRKTAVASILDSMRTWNGAVAGCFHPRHALRVTHQNVVFDFVICFECQTIRLYRGAESHGYVNITGKPDKLDELLKKAGILLPAPASVRPLLVK